MPSPYRTVPYSYEYTLTSTVSYEYSYCTVFVLVRCTVPYRTPAQLLRCRAGHQQAASPIPATVQYEYLYGIPYDSHAWSRPRPPFIQVTRASPKWLIVPYRTVLAPACACRTVHHDEANLKCALLFRIVYEYIQEMYSNCQQNPTSSAFQVRYVGQAVGAEGAAGDAAKPQSDRTTGHDRLHALKRCKQTNFPTQKKIFSTIRPVFIDRFQAISVEER